MLAKTITTRSKRLQDQGLPPDRAELKAESTAVGYLAALPGLALCLVSGLTVILALLFDVEVTWKVLAAIGVPAALGLLLVALGFSLISREAAPWIGKVGEWAVKMVRGLRGKNGT